MDQSKLLEHSREIYTYLFSLPGYLQLLLILLFPSLWFYRWITDPPKQKTWPHLFNRKSENFRRLRAKTFPPPYPNGWWKIAHMEELKDGKIKSVDAFGRSFVVFKGKNGKVGVLDAHCPHQGAHLGGGEVIDNCIQCPFHHWEMDCDGKVNNIPYFEGKNFPDYKTKTYPIHIVNDDLIFVWFHVDNEPPSWEMEDKSHWKNSDWYYWGCSTSEFDMHILEMAGDFKMEFDEKKKHVHYFDNNAKIYLFDTIPLPTGPQFSHLVFEGPGIVTFNLHSIFGLVQLYKTILPVGEFHTYCEDRIYAKNTVPRWFLRVYAYFASLALEQGTSNRKNRPVWESKIFRDPPLLVKGDGPWPAHRKWWNQFYSKNSSRMPENLNW